MIRIGLGVQMARFSTERWAALAGLGFVVAYVAAFSMGIEVGPSDREILDYYADSGHRAREMVAFFLIAAAALCLLLFSHGIRVVVDRAGPAVSSAARVAFAGGLAGSVLILAGNALSRATAFAATDAEFELEPNTRRLFENAGFLLFVCGALAAILLTAGVAVAALRHGVLPRWLGWSSIVTAVLLPLAIAFVGFLVFLLWVLFVSGVLAFRRRDLVPA
jgi:hypothetical protein